MYSNFKEQAIAYVRQAVQEDNSGNYAKAFPLYMNALEYFKTHLKYEKNPKIKEDITQKFVEYLRRAEEILAVLDEGGSGAGSNGGDGAVVAKPKDGEDGGEDPEQSKLRAGLNSAIVREKPNVKWNDVAGLDKDDSNSMPKTENMGSKDERIIAQQLKIQFHGTRKGYGETIESYVQNLRSTADSLTAINSPISDQDLVLQLLAGLPTPQYLPYQNRISSQIPLPDFQGACSLLYMYESLLQEQKANPTSSSSSDSPLEGGNYSKQTFDKIVDVFSTVSNVATMAWDIWSVFRPSSTTTTANTGNKKFTKRPNGGRGNYNKRGPPAGGYRNSGRK